MSAYIAQTGLTGAQHILEGKPRSRSWHVLGDSDPSKFVDRLGSRWALAETNFKYYASCCRCTITSHVG
jgi:2-methylcitrate dehydratase PrpD